MASNYNKLPIPPVVLVKDGESQLIVKGQSYQQLLENEQPYQAFGGRVDENSL